MGASGKKRHAALHSDVGGSLPERASQDTCVPAFPQFLCNRLMSGLSTATGVLAKGSRRSDERATTSSLTSAEQSGAAGRLQSPTKDKC